MPQTELLPHYLDVEGYHAAVKLLRDVLFVRPGESVVITNDTSGDERATNQFYARIIGDRWVTQEKD